MFKNLRAEMARLGVSGKEVAAGIQISERSFSKKMRGETEFTRTEMLKIHRNYFPQCSIDYLFEMTAQVHA